MGPGDTTDHGDYGRGETPAATTPDDPKYIDEVTDGVIDADNPDAPFSGIYSQDD